MVRRRRVQRQAELTRRADDGDQDAMWKLARLLARRGDEAGLARRADAGERFAAMTLADLLAERGDEAGLALAAPPSAIEPPRSCWLGCSPSATTQLQTNAPRQSEHDRGVHG